MKDRFGGTIIETPKTSIPPKTSISKTDRFGGTIIETPKTSGTEFSYRTDPQVPHGKRLLENYVRPTLQGVGSAAGILLGGGAGAFGGPAAPATVPAGAIIGGGLGYAVGDELADLLDQWFGYDEPKPILLELQEAAENIALGTTYEMGGYAAGPALGLIGKGIKSTKPGQWVSEATSKVKDWHKATSMPLSDKGVKQKAGEVLMAMTHKGPIIVDNIAKAEALEEAIPGLKFNLGQLTGDPGVIKHTQFSTITAGDLAVMQAEQTAANTKAINEFIKKSKGIGITEDFIKPLAAKEKILGKTTEKASKELEEETLAKIGQMGPIDIGTTIRKELTIGEKAARKKASKLFKEVPEQNQVIDDLIETFKNILKPSHPNEGADKFPSVLKRAIANAKVSIKEETLPTKPEMTLMHLQGLRSEILEDARIAGKRGAPQSLLARLYKAVEAIDKKLSGDIVKSIKIKPQLVKVDYKKLKASDETFENEIKNWLEDKTKKMPMPKFLYRGVPKGKSITFERGEYSHGTPWAFSASRGGKGAFGDPRSTDVYKIPIEKDVIYYRGGALEGDPLESTRIPSTKGMTWKQIMNKAKELYRQDLASYRAETKKRGLKGVEIDENYVANKVLKDISNASFEVDLQSKKGIWRGKPIQPEINIETPKLRSNEDLKKIVELKRKQGYKDEDIPELNILKRSEQLLFKETPSKQLIKAQKYFREEVIEKYGKGTTGAVLSGPDAVQDAMIAGKFFKSGPAGEQAATEFMNTLGDNPIARNALKEYINQNLLDAVISPKTGEVTSTALNRWLTTHKLALKKLGLKDDFNSLIKAKQQVDKALIASKEFEKSTTSSILKADIDEVVQKAFAKGSKEKAAKDLVEQITESPFKPLQQKAIKGLQNAMIDNILTDVSLGSVFPSKKIIANLKKYDAALKVVFKDAPKKLKAMHQVRSAMQIMERGTITPKSGIDRAENLIVYLARRHGFSRSAIINVARAAIGPLRRLSDKQVNTLVNRALIDPNVAHSLMSAARGGKPEKATRTLINNLATLGLIAQKKEEKN